jgi:LPXTG-motif cell wall-anchored protein
MKILTKRNALLGWLTWKVGKGVAKKKAKGVVPGKSSSGKKKPVAAIAGLGAALGGLALLKRKRKSGDSSSSE